ncbi:MAG: cytochrome C oxidase subunit IV family protein [Planctomycetales bacterium]
MSDHDTHAATGEEAHHDEHHAEHHHVNYWAIFGALCLLTAASWLADEVGGSLGKVLLGVIVLTIASFKAMFVMLYFMHLKFEGKWKIVLLAPTIILAVAIIAALMPDIGAHYYDVQVPQVQQAAAAHAESGAHGASETHPASDSE